MNIYLPGRYRKHRGDILPIALWICLCLAFSCLLPEGGIWQRTDAFLTETIQLGSCWHSLPKDICVPEEGERIPTFGKVRTSVPGVRSRGETEPVWDGWILLSCLKLAASWSGLRCRSSHHTVYRNCLLRYIYHQDGL